MLVSRRVGPQIFSHFWRRQNESLPFFIKVTLVPPLKGPNNTPLSVPSLSEQNVIPYAWIMTTPWKMETLENRKSPVWKGRSSEPSTSMTSGSRPLIFQGVAGSWATCFQKICAFVKLDDFPKGKHKPPLRLGIFAHKYLITNKSHHG